MKKMLLAAVILGGLPMGAAWAAPLSPQDQTFVREAAVGGMTEVRAGKLASHKAQMADVKQFATQMVSDHMANDQDLTALAKQKAIALPAALDSEHARMLTMLRKTPKAQFDETYIQGQISGHQEMAAVMQTEIQSGTDPDLKAFATKTLPVVQGHLAMAQQLQPKT